MFRTRLCIAMIIAALTILPACAPKDTTPPEVASVSPSFGAEEVPLSDAINITFTKPMDKASVSQTFLIDPPASGSHAWAGDTFSFVPDGLFPGTEYLITFSSPPRDTAGNQLREFSLSFVTGTPDASIYEIESYAWLPDGSGLVFAADRGGQFGLWQVDLISRTQRLLIEDPDGLTSPAVAPDGRTIACVSPSKPYLYLYNTNSGVISKYDAGLDTGWLASPVFSPDGQKLALVSAFGYADAHSDIYQETLLVDLSRQPPVFVKASPTSETDWVIGFTEDSDSLYLLSTYNNYNHSRDFRYDFWKVSIASGDLVRLTDDGPMRNFHSGSYSASRQWFAASSWEARETGYTIIEVPILLQLFDLAGGAIRSLSPPGYSAFPAISPEGEALIYVFASAEAPERWDIIRSTGTGGTSSPLTHSGHLKTHLSYSPDGSYIAFIQVVGESHAIWVMQSDGGELRRLSK
ncbi:MAG TPA: Ig-like domain-containing protein [Bacillota bacterium]|nr:Ig-like domain-containing protein [Bacillota bacterium]